MTKVLTSSKLRPNQRILLRAKHLRTKQKKNTSQIRVSQMTNNSRFRCQAEGNARSALKGKISLHQLTFRLSTKLRLSSSWMRSHSSSSESLWLALRKLHSSGIQTMISFNLIVSQQALWSKMQKINPE